MVTVKAELAGRLIDVDPERAKAEVADLERLSRDVLADVRYDSEVAASVPVNPGQVYSVCASGRPGSLARL